MPDPCTYDYAIIRVVPRVERGEFVNAGVIVSSRRRGLPRRRASSSTRRACSRSIPHVDLDAVRAALAAIPRSAPAAPQAGPIGRAPLRERFHWLVAPRSTMIQTSPVHTGRCDDLAAALEHLLERMVRPPTSAGTPPCALLSAPGARRRRPAVPADRRAGPPARARARRTSPRWSRRRAARLRRARRADGPRRRRAAARRRRAGRRDRDLRRTRRATPRSSSARCAPASRSRRSRRRSTPASFALDARRRRRRACCSSTPAPTRCSARRRRPAAAASRSTASAAAPRSTPGSPPPGSAPRAGRRSDPEWPFNIIYSSGTTGTPKGIVQPHAMRWAHVERGGALRLRRRRGDAARDAALLEHHAGRLLPDARLRRHRGADAEVRRRRATSRSPSAHRVTHTMLVPVQYQRLMALPDSTATTCRRSA